MTDPQQAPVGLLDEDGRLTQTVTLETREEPGDRVTFATTGTIGPAMIVVVAALLLVYAVPALEIARPWKPGDPVPFWNVLGRPFETEELAETHERASVVDSLAREVLTSEEPTRREVTPRPTIDDPGARLPPYVARPGDEKPAVQAIELFSGDELDRFMHALARSDAGIEGAVTRVVHWGDSAIGIDGIPSAIRRRMQGRFGDAGHGFHLMAPPNSSYRHREVSLRHNDAWKLCFIIFRCKRDGRYGLGGTTVWGPRGASSTFAPHPTRSSGRVSRFDVWYLAQPRGGTLRVRVDKGEWTELDTAADELVDRWHPIVVEDGHHTLEVRSRGGGRVRLYGVTLERDGPGVVWDGLAQVGAFTNRMLAYDEEHLSAQLEHRAADLVVLTFGGNDMIRSISMEKYGREYQKVIELMRRARPEADCLIMAPLDHGERKGRRLISRPVVPAMVAAQRDVARAAGCAFFDTFAAMGGEGAAGRWFRRSPRLISGDLSHATLKGQQVIGELVYRALIEAYVAYRERTELDSGNEQVTTR